MKKCLHLPGEIIFQFLQDNEEGIKQILTWFLNAIMEYEAQFQAGATHYERTTSRKAYRNGYRKRTLKTRYGALELLKPQLREFPFQTQVFERYSRVEKALQNAVVESSIQGVPTRRIREIIDTRGSGASPTPTQLALAFSLIRIHKTTHAKIQHRASASLSAASMRLRSRFVRMLTRRS